MSRRDLAGVGPFCAMAATRRAARLLTQLYDRHLSEHGIEGAQFALLMTINALEDKGQTAVAQAMGMDKTTLSRNVKLLRERGWVEVAAGEDARSRLLALTVEGRALLARARPAWQRAQRALRHDLGEERWEPMLATLKGLAEAAEAAIG